MTTRQAPSTTRHQLAPEPGCVLLTAEQVAGIRRAVGMLINGEDNCTHALIHSLAPLLSEYRAE